MHISGPGDPSTAQGPDCPSENRAGNSDEAFKTTRERRLTLCLECPALRKYLKVPKTEQCGICMCFVRIKSAVPSEKCPAGLW